LVALFTLEGQKLVKCRTLARALADPPRVGGVASLTGPFANLTYEEARKRKDLMEVTNYDISLDLTKSDRSFLSEATVDFHSEGGPTFVDLKALDVHRVVLNGQALNARINNGRIKIQTEPGVNQLSVRSTMAFRNDGEGLHRSVDPADGNAYIYGMSFMDAAPSIFACFDQPDLKATFQLRVKAPRAWHVIGNGVGEQVSPGQWQFQKTPPLSTYLFTLVAGPYHVVHDYHDGIELGLSVRASLAGALDTDAAELFTLTKQCFDEFHRLFGIRYAFGDYHQAFVPEFNAGAMENPGCVTYRDQFLSASYMPRAIRVQRATTVAHEMAHQWFGNLVTPRWWDDLWLNESFAEYLGVRVVQNVSEFVEVRAVEAHSSRGRKRCPGRRIRAARF
jgi:aminopeptidase N